MDWDLEELARAALDQADVGAPVDPDLVAKGLELVVRDGGRGCVGYLIGDRIFVDESARSTRRAFAIAHEIGHHLQRKHGVRDTERGANYLAAALLLPRLDFIADLRRCGWDLIALRARHRHASFEALARRITALRGARACIFDRPLRGQAPPKSYVIPNDRTRPTEEERIAAREAMECGAPVELRPGLTAWPVLEHDWHRAITIAA